MTDPIGYSENTATLYPSHGDINTRIHLQIRGIGGELYLYWHDILLSVYSANVEEFLGFDIYFYPSDVYKYSNDTEYSKEGNHSVFIQVFYWYWGGIDVGNIHVTWNTTLSFEITEYAPCPEFIALNATYHELLSNYTTLIGNCSDLLDQYTTLQQNYYSLLADHNNLLASFNSLSDNYDSLSDAYNKLVSNFNDLNSSYFNMQTNYQTLNASYSNLAETLTQLQTNYNNLQGTYNSLNNNYSFLQATYNTLIGETAITRNMSYLFAFTTMLFLTTTVFFAVRKTKQK